ncbi:MAG: hypothetical protein OES13_00895 [Acidimicrobiia bacterium]|nr:hypothetical protein [Acidimicrobiia bacterium]
MRIALDATGEVGKRAGLILLNGTGVEALGLVDGDPRPDADSRVTRADDLGDYDGVITDREDPRDIFARAVAGDTQMASWVDFQPDDSGITVLGGANLATGITTCLAFHEAARSTEVLEEVLAWTQPGRALRRGTAVAFPDPVGARWGTRLPEGDDAIPTTRIVVPLDGDWAGASAQVTCATTEGVVRRVVGVADLAVHLEAIALAAAGATLEHFPARPCQAVESAEIYLSKTLEMGLAVATYVDGTPASR